MKLAVDSLVPFLRLGDEGMVKTIKDAGFDALDFSFYNVPDNQSAIGDNYLERAHEIRALLDKYGLACNQAHAPYNLEETEAFDLSNPRFKAQVRALEFASILGAKNIIVHAIKHISDKEHLFEVNYRFYKSFEPYCKEFGIHVAVENLWNRDEKRRSFVGVFGTAEELTRMVKMLDSPWFVACVDVGHAALAGTEPEKFIAGMSPDILRCLHLHDTDYLSDTHTIPFLGGHNWDGITRALAKIGYEGDFTLEILLYAGSFPDALLADSLVLAEKTGRQLIRMFEEAGRNG